MDDLVKRAVEALEGVSEAPWAIDEGGEVHKDGRTIYAWPKWNGADFDGQTERNMAFGVEARVLVPAMLARILELEQQLRRERAAAAAAAEKWLIDQAAAKGGTKTPQGRTAQFYARKLKTLLTKSTGTGKTRD